MISPAVVQPMNCASGALPCAVASATDRSCLDEANRIPRLALRSPRSASADLTACSVASRVSFSTTAPEAVMVGMNCPPVTRASVH